MELLIERNLPLPFGSLHSLVRMCEARLDLYGICEALRLNQQERMRARTDSFQQKQEKIQKRYLDNVFVDGDFSANPSAKKMDQLANNDWKKALNAVLLCRQHLPNNVYVEAFTEVNWHYSR